MSRDYVLQPFRAPTEFHIDYRSELNDQQYAAVTAAPGPALVIAGAGSGKTRTLTYRVAFLIEQGIPPERILLLTFTNKAAREMMRRVADLLGSELSSLWGGTFHSIGNRVLRRHVDLLGFGKGFSILDREDAKDLINACVTDLQIDVKESRFPKADVLGDIISMALNKQQSIAEILAQDYAYFVHLTSSIEEVAKKYSARKRSGNVMDFDDLLVLWLNLLRDHAEVREHYQRRFQFILVDEYQDTNKLQGDLIDLLADRHKNVMVVGDDSQSIYGWRGAHFLNILQFPARYAGASTYKIETNYRSTPEILNVANAAIAANLQQFAKELTAARKPGNRPVLVPCGDGAEQAAFVAQRVLELRDEGANMNEMVVLYRSHFHALELQLELTRRHIPFSITSGIRFFEQAHIKDVAAFLKWVSNPRDELSFKRLVRMLPGVGGKGAEKLWAEFTAAFSAAPVEQGNPVIATALQKASTAVGKKTAVAWAQFVATIAQLESPQVNGAPAAMIRLVLDAVYEDLLKEQYANYRQRLEDVQQLSAFAEQFKDLNDFLTQLALLTNVETNEQPASTDQEQLKLSTVHQAKGLEFDIVFIIMLCDGSFPSARSVSSVEGEEEERRLFYVAITRARNELYLSYPLIRMTHGNSGDAMQQPSRFLSEIPRELLDEWNLRSFNPYA